LKKKIADEEKERANATVFGAQRQKRGGDSFNEVNKKRRPIFLARKMVAKR
jgi:hypothetical protein